MHTALSHSPQHTFDIARQIIAISKPGDTLLFAGDLGTGKTTLIQGIAQELGVSESVTSPTFVLHRQYQTTHPTISVLHHLDLYRIEREDELLNIGIEELLDQDQGIVAIEWADKFEGLLKQAGRWIYTSYVNENTREFRWYSR